MRPGRKFGSVNDGASAADPACVDGGVELEVARRRSARLTRKRRHDRRIAGFAGEVAGVALVDHDRVRAADHGLAVAVGIPDQPDARLEVAAVLRHLRESAGADLQQRRRRRIEGDELVVLLRRRRQVVVAQAEIELEVRAQRDRILDERADGIDVGVVSACVPSVMLNGAAESLLERRDAGIGEAARDPD